MRHQRNACFLDGIVTTSLRGRYKDHVRIGSQHHLRIEVALHTNLHDPSILHTIEDILIEEVLCAGNAFHYIMGIKDREVRQLQGCHTDGILNRYANLYIVRRHLHSILRHQGEMIVIAYIHQPYTGTILYLIARRILRTRQRICFRYTCSCLIPLTARATKTKNYANNRKNTKTFHLPHLIILRCKDTTFVVIRKMFLHIFV